MPLKAAFCHSSVPLFVTLSLLPFLTCGSNTGADTSSTMLSGPVSIVNGRLTRDGNAKDPLGFVQVGSQASLREQNVPALKAQAENYYTPQEYTDMAHAGDNSVHIMSGHTVGTQSLFPNTLRSMSNSNETARACSDGSGNPTLALGPDLTLDSWYSKGVLPTTAL